ncbi:MAG: ATP-binding protein [Alphaproteobacteria bacterium]|nr:ATP-binding protein [Alphaproteobacteria bacterium]
MVKSLVIIGVPRSGKTTLAKSILALFSADKKPVAFLSADSIIGGMTDVQKSNLFWGIFIRPMRHIFPKLNDKTKSARIKSMLAFAARFIAETSDVVPVVYEGAYITPNDARKIFNTKKCMIVVIGYPNMTTHDKIQQIRKFDGKTPYQKRDDKELESVVAHNIEKSQQMQAQAKKSGYMFIDTSTDYHGSINRAAREIYKKLQK